MQFSDVCITQGSGTSLFKVALCKHDMLSNVNVLFTIMRLGGLLGGKYYYFLCVLLHLWQLLLICRFVWYSFMTFVSTKNSDLVLKLIISFNDEKRKIEREAKGSENIKLLQELLKNIFEGKLQNS